MNFIKLFFLTLILNCHIVTPGQSMKTIGLLGGTGWSSTIGYYQQLNELVNARLGGYHSAKIILKSIDYHAIMTQYGKNHELIAGLLKKELQELIQLQPDCIIICCNSLHKYYDMIRPELNSDIPVMHAVDLVVQHCVQSEYKKVLFLATKFTMEDGFFAQKLQNAGIDVVIPDSQQRNQMQQIHGQLMQNHVTQKSRDYFEQLIEQYSDCDAVILGCTEYPLVVDQTNCSLPIIDPVKLQVKSAVDFAIF
jgi:aspartate racemase